MYLNLGLDPYIFLPGTRACGMQYKTQQYKNVGLAPYIFFHHVPEPVDFKMDMPSK
jgi:hypothetical protein